MADALAQALAWRKRVANLRRLRAGRAQNSHTNDIAGAPAILYPEYRDNPEGFAVEVLGIKPWSAQIRILRSVVEHVKTAVRSGHKIGKSTSAAIIALWWFGTRPRASIVMTSSSDTQIKEILWPEVHRLYRGAKKPLGGTLYDSHRSGLRADDGRKIVGISTNSTENMGGFSGEELLFIGDEASGIDEAIFRAIEGNLAGGGHFILFGNPTQMSGTFFEAFHGKAEFWNPIHVSSTDTPNASGQGEPIPGLATKKWVDQMTAEHGGPGNPEWDIRVGGNFPTEGRNNVIGLGLVDAGFKNWAPPVPEDGRLEFGVDPARYGDDETVIYARRGKVMYAPRVLRSMNGIEVAEAVIAMVAELRAPEPDVTLVRTVDGGEEHIVPNREKPRVKVDVIGVGASVVDQLSLHKNIVEVVEVNVAESATDERYFRLRDQLWFAARDWLKEGGKMQLDAKLRQELIAPRYRVEPGGQIRVSSKDEIKEEIGRSPDRADAFALAIYSPPRKVMKRTPGSVYGR